MKIKLTAFLAIGVLAFIGAVGLFGSLPQTSAEEFAANFKAKGFVLNPADDRLTGTYQFDTDHSSIGFRVKHMGLVEVPGYFRDFTGTVGYDGKDISKSWVEFSAKVTSVDTGVERRDNHLRTKDFFEVEKYPSMTFKSTTIVKKGGVWMVNGDLTMKDVTKKISFPFNVTGFVESPNNVKIGITAATTVNRRDFNVNYGGNLPNGVPMLSDDIAVNLQIEAIKHNQTSD